MPDRSAPSTPLWQSVRSSKREKESRSIIIVIRLVRREEERGGNRLAVTARFHGIRISGERQAVFSQRQAVIFLQDLKEKGKWPRSWDKTWWFMTILLRDIIL
jgi:hypothetical protein